MKALNFLWIAVWVLVLHETCFGQPPSPSNSDVADWLHQLRQGDETGSSDAAFAFDPTGVDAHDAATRLISAMTHDSPFVRLHVIVALGELAEPPELVVPAQVGAIRDNDRRVRKFALASLIRTGATATPYLASAMADLTVIEEQDVGREAPILVADYAAFALSRVDGPIVPACVDVLRAQIEIEKRNRQLPEVIALERRFSDVLQRLSDLRDDISYTDSAQLADEHVNLKKSLAKFLVADTYLRRAAVVINARTGRDMEHLLPLFESDDPAFQRMALLAVGPASELAIPAVTKVLYGTSESLQEEAIAALQRTGEPGAPVVAKAMLDHPSADIRRAAARSIRGVESAAENLLQTLMNSEDDEIRIAAADALASAFFKAGLHRDSETASQPFELEDLEHRVILAFVETLENKNVALRTASARGLWTLVRRPHPSLVPLVPKLIERLNDFDGELKAEIASVLGAIGNDAASAVPILLEEIEKLDDPQSGSVTSWEISARRNTLIRALGGMGVKTEQVETALLAILRDAERAAEHAAVIETLGRLRTNNAVPAIVQYCTEAKDESGAWGIATETLLNIEPSGVEALTSLLADQSQAATVRQRICRALGNSRSMDQRVVSALIAATSDSDAMLRLDAAHGLASRGVAEENVVPVLIQWLPYLNRGSGGLRNALRSLQSYPEPASAALVAWLQQISDVEARDRVIALLHELQKNDPRLMGVTAYLENLAREDIERYADGIRTLAEISIANDQTTALAIEGLHHTNPEVRENAVLALRNLRPADPQLAVTALHDLLRRETTVTAESPSATESPAGVFEPMPPYALGALLITLASYGADARDTVPDLLDLLAHPSSSVREDAATALGRIGVDTEEVRSNLTKLTNAPEPSVQESATQALLTIGVAPQALPNSLMENTILTYLDNDLEPFLWQLSRALRPQPVVYREAALVRSGRAGIYSLPPLPWPPPRYTHRATFGRDIPRDLLGEDDTTLGEIYENLYQTLLSVDDGFESGLFRVGHDGFALLAKLERIDREGAPLPGAKRWVYGELGPLSFKDYLGRLFFEKPGYFRVVAFVITPKKLFGYSDAPLPHISEGGSDLPDHIAELTFKDRNAYVLIYSFERRRGGKVRLFDELGPRTHLLKSGILASLGAL